MRTSGNCLRIGWVSGGCLGAEGGGPMAKNGEKWRWRIQLFHLSNSPFFANF